MQAKRFKILLNAAAKRDLMTLESEQALQIAQDIRTYLEVNPIPLGKPRLKKLLGFDPPLYRLRSGDFRAYYRIEGDQVIVSAVRPKKDSEKFLKRIQEERAAFKKQPEF
jgi:mRNA-degrading endonuclease RelE of RelBE toxin-antitoxin system